jgi:plasmid stability protein
MNTHLVTVNLPKALYNRIRKRADESKRSVEMELLEVVASAMPEGDELPEDLARAAQEISMLDDKSLWRAARKKLDAKSAAKLASLHKKRQSQGLNKTETQQLEELVGRYERIMLVRAQSAALLKARGQDVSRLIANV